MGRCAFVTSGEDLVFSDPELKWIHFFGHMKMCDGLISSDRIRWQLRIQYLNLFAASMISCGIKKCDGLPVFFYGRLRISLITVKNSSPVEFHSPTSGGWKSEFLLSLDIKVWNAQIIKHLLSKSSKKSIAGVQLFQSYIPACHVQLIINQKVFGSGFSLISGGAALLVPQVSALTDTRE